MLEILHKNIKIIFTVLLLTGTTALQAAVVTVTPSNTDGWHAAEQAGMATGSISTDMPRGRGNNASLKFETTGTADRIHARKFVSTTVDQITQFGMDYYTTDTTVAPTLKIVYTQFFPYRFGTLTWEPANQGPVTPGSWQDAQNAATGLWWSSEDGYGQADKRTLAAWGTELSGIPAISISVAVGSGWPTPMTGYADVVTLKIGAAEPMTYDFEVDDTTEPLPPQILSYAKFGGVIGERKVKGNEKTMNVSFEGIAVTVGTNTGTPEVPVLDVVGQIGLLEVNYRNGTTCTFAPDPADILGFNNQFYFIDGEQGFAQLSWNYACDNDDEGTAFIVLLNSGLTNLDVFGVNFEGMPANGTYYLPGASGKGRTKFRGAICIFASDSNYSVDGGSNVVVDDGAAEALCSSDALPENSGDLQWGNIEIGGYTLLPL